MLVQRGNREDAIHALMNLWLKDDRRWCLNCNTFFDPVGVRFGCCDQPFMTTNALVFQHFKREMQEIRDSQKNEFASTESDTGMRYLLRFPPGMLEFLEMSMKKLYDEKLFTEGHDQQWFARKFGKHFCVAQKI